MKYLQAGFRSLYRHFVIFPMNQVVKRKLEYFPESRYANAVIGYGYYDPFAGMSVEVLGAGFFEDGGVRIGKSNNDITFRIPMKELADYEYYILDDDPVLIKEYSFKLEGLKKYILRPELEAIVNMEFLDEFRDPFMIDHIQVVFQKSGYSPEKLYCRVLGRREHSLVAILLEDSVCFHEMMDGRLIEFYMEKREEKEICICDIDSLKYYNWCELRDGKLLKKAIHEYYTHHKTSYYYMEVLEIIRESHFFVGGYYYLDEDNVRKFQIETIPHYEQYLPVYSDEMEANRFVQEEIYEMDLMKITELAENSDIKFKKIMINFQTEPFDLDRGIWIALREMISLSQNIN